MYFTAYPKTSKVEDPLLAVQDGRSVDVLRHPPRLVSFPFRFRRRNDEFRMFFNMPMTKRPKNWQAKFYSNVIVIHICLFQMSKAKPSFKESGGWKLRRSWKNTTSGWGLWLYTWCKTNPGVIGLFQTNYISLVSLFRAIPVACGIYQNLQGSIGIIPWSKLEPMMLFLWTGTEFRNTLGPHQWFVCLQSAAPAGTFRWDPIGVFAKSCGRTCQCGSKSGSCLHGSDTQGAGLSLRRAWTARAARGSLGSPFPFRVESRSPLWSNDSWPFFLNQLQDGMEQRGTMAELSEGIWTRPLIEWDSATALHFHRGFWSRKQTSRQSKGVKTQKA